MMLGGFLDQMRKTIQQNRNLLKRTTFFNQRDYRIYDKPLAQKEKGAVIEPTAVDEETLRQIRIKLKKQRRSKRIKAFFIFGFATSLIGFILFKILNGPRKDNRFVHEESPKTNKHFKAVNRPIGKGRILRIEYFNFGPKSAETKYKNGMKHQQSTSFYPTGEVFRAAAYFYDTLITEVYYYKNGDTIKNFPGHMSQTIQHITLVPNDSLRLNFDFYDGKIMTGTYIETATSCPITLLRSP